MGLTMGVDAGLVRLEDGCAHVWVYLPLFTGCMHSGVSEDRADCMTLF